MKKLLLSVLFLGISSEILCDSAFDEGEKHYYKGCFFGSANNHFAAIDCFNKAIALCPHESNAWEARGEEYFAISNYAQSIIDFTQALALNLHNQKAYVGRALSYFKIGNMIACKADIITAAKLGSTEGQAIAVAWGWSW